MNFKPVGPTRGILALALGVFVFLGSGVLVSPATAGEKPSSGQASATEPDGAVRNAGGQGLPDRGVGPVRGDMPPGAQASGMMAFIDPETGKLVAEPVDGEFPSSPAWQGRSVAPQAAPSPVRGGGQVIDASGLHTNFVFSAVDPSTGKPSTECQGRPGGAAHRHGETANE